MRSGILEIVGIFLVVVGACGLMGAAAMVSVALAVAAGAVFVLLAGVIAIYVAVTLEQQATAARAAQGPVRGEPR